MTDKPMYGMSKDLAKYATGPLTTLPEPVFDEAHIEAFNEMLVALDKRDFPEYYIDPNAPAYLRAALESDRAFALKYAEALKALSENKESK